MKIGLRWNNRHKIVLLLAVVLLALAGAVPASAANSIPIRLVALMDRDDQGEGIEFPYWLYYDYWSSETYLLSSNGRITIYDQKFFPVASFGKGRGVGNPRGVAVDRQGNIYVCQDVPTVGANQSRLTIYNQAFFPIRHVVFANIPELADFTANKVAVSESGEIYLTGHRQDEAIAGVIVLTPEGRFSRVLLSPERSVWRPRKKTAPAKPGADENTAAPPASDPEADSEAAPALPAGLKPKPSSRAREDEDAQGGGELPYVNDVKIDRQGRIYLLSSEAGNVYVFNAREEYLFKFGEKGGAEGKLSTPVSLAVDLERRVIYVCDYMRHTILCYDYDSGRYVFEFGGRGLGPLWFNFPNSVEVDQRGRVIVSDLFNRRLQVIDPNIGERRPLAGTLAGLAPGVQPPAVETGPVEQPPEIMGPGPAALPAPLTVTALPGTVVAGSLPAPAPPPLQTPLAAPGEGLLPLGVVPLNLPSLAIGAASAPIRIPLAAVSSPPARPAAMPVRELAPSRQKRVLAPRGPALKAATITPVASPGKIPKPGPVHFGKEGAAGAKPRRLGAEPVGILARFRAMPAAVGVYGPVAALLGVGSWLLYTNR